MSRIGHEEPLKQIAGLIQKLPYRDMVALGNAISNNCGLEATSPLKHSITEALLKASDELLKPPAKMPEPAPGAWRR